MMVSINTTPRVDIRQIQSTVSGTPVVMKSAVERYGFLKSLTINKEFTFGKEEKGRAMAVETRVFN